ncbi:hypothetical protein ACOMHN_024476 [Nucella lapillus]
MATAVHVARTSPPRLQTLHPAMVPPSSLPMPHPAPLPYDPMGHKQYFHSSFPDHHFPPFHPLHPLLPPLPPPSAVTYEAEEVEEDIDEDDMSDLEEEFQQVLLAFRNRQREPDMTRQLLTFADRVSADITKVFGRKKGDEDSCDVYEDKWTVTKSGRELYYADLLRIAHGDFGDSKSPSSKTSSKHKNAEVSEDNRHSFTGRADLSLGLGPLGELFDQGLHTGKQKKTPSHNSASKRQRTDSQLTTSKSVPMSGRSLPESFWVEPGVGGQTTGSSGLDLPVATSSVVHSLSSGKLPDFSDLMDSWNGDQAQQQQHQQLHTLQSIQHPLLHQHQHQHQQRPSVFDTTALSTDPNKKRRL